MSAAAQDAALATMGAATDRRRIGWILGRLREDVVHTDYRDHAALLPEGPAKDLLPVLCPIRGGPSGGGSRIYAESGCRLPSMTPLV